MREFLKGETLADRLLKGAMPTSGDQSTIILVQNWSREIDRKARVPIFIDFPC